MQPQEPNHIDESGLSEGDRVRRVYGANATEFSAREALRENHVAMEVARMNAGMQEMTRAGELAKETLGLRAQIFADAARKATEMSRQEKIFRDQAALHIDRERRIGLDSKRMIAADLLRDSMAARMAQIKPVTIPKPEFGPPIFRDFKGPEAIQREHQESLFKGLGDKIEELGESLQELTKFSIAAYEVQKQSLSETRASGKLDYWILGLGVVAAVTGMVQIFMTWVKP